MINDKIEIFILTYNRSMMLETAIRSVLNQTVKTKLTVVDNHSPDDTPQMIERLKAEGADFMYIRRTENGGAGANVATAKEHFSYPYVMIFHDDDALHPQYIEVALSVLNAHSDIDIIASSIVDFRNDDELDFVHKDLVTYKEFATKQQFVSYVYCANVLRPDETLHYSPVIYRSAYYCNARGRNDIYGKIDDTPFVFDCIKSGRIIQMTTPMAFIRRHAGQDTKDSATGCSMEQVLNVNSVYRAHMELQRSTAKLYWMICGRHLKGHSNFGNGQFSVFALFMRAIRERVIKVRSFFLLGEYGVQKLLHMKSLLVLHRHLWKCASELYSTHEIRFS